MGVRNRTSSREPSAFEEMRVKSENIGKNLKQIIELLGCTQAEFAERCGITQAAVSQILNGEREPSLKTIIQILKVVPTTFERLCK